MIYFRYLDILPRSQNYKHNIFNLFQPYNAFFRLLKYLSNRVNALESYYDKLMVVLVFK